MLLPEHADNVFHDGSMLCKSFEKIAPGRKCLRHLSGDERGARLNLFPQLFERDNLCALLGRIQLLRFPSQQVNGVSESFNQARIEEARSIAGRALQKRASASP